MKKNAFTIVELLVVVVIIARLRACCERLRALRCGA